MVHLTSSLAESAEQSIHWGCPKAADSMSEARREAKLDMRGWSEGRQKHRVVVREEPQKADSVR